MVLTAHSAFTAYGQQILIDAGRTLSAESNKA